MAQTFNSGSLFGSGSLVTQQLTATTAYTFRVRNFNVDTNNGYLTLEGNSTANSNLAATVTVTGSLNTFTGDMALVSESQHIVTSGTKWSINIPYVNLAAGDGTFRFTPSTTIAANKVYLKGTGQYTVNITP
jgi:hypothetical protein|tara:strand:+ start:334 stop:729 length:396 start_codon:yes stop_codon:yes gene_type:complete